MNSLMEHCEVSRWHLLKSTLNNLTFVAFQQALLSNQEAICIDARTPEEFDSWHLKGAINISYLAKDLVDQLDRLDPDLVYYVYCRTSRRSLRICVLMRNMGFTQVYHLEEGVKAYIGS